MKETHLPNSTNKPVLELRDLRKSFCEADGNALDVIHIGRFDLAVGEQAALVGAASFFGFWIAYQWDMPVGPTDVVLLGLLYAAGWIVYRCLQVFRTAKMHQFKGNAHARFNN